MLCDELFGPDPALPLPVPGAALMAAIEASNALVLPPGIVLACRLGPDVMAAGELSLVIDARRRAAVLNHDRRICAVCVDFAAATSHTLPAQLAGFQHLLAALARFDAAAAPRTALLVPTPGTPLDPVVRSGSGFSQVVIKGDGASEHLVGALEAIAWRPATRRAHLTVWLGPAAVEAALVFGIDEWCARVTRALDTEDAIYLAPALIPRTPGVGRAPVGACHDLAARLSLAGLARVAPGCYVVRARHRERPPALLERLMRYGECEVMGLGPGATSCFDHVWCINVGDSTAHSRRIAAGQSGVARAYRLGPTFHLLRELRLHLACGVSVDFEHMVRAHDVAEPFADELYLRLTELVRDDALTLDRSGGYIIEPTQDMRLGEVFAALREIAVPFEVRPLGVC